MGEELESGKIERSVDLHGHVSRCSREVDQLHQVTARLRTVAFFHLRYRDAFERDEPKPLVVPRLLESLRGPARRYVEIAMKKREPTERVEAGTWAGGSPAISLIRHNPWASAAR